MPPEAEPTPAPDFIERINTVRVQVVGDTILVKSKRACGHGQTLTLGQGSDVQVVFGATWEVMPDGNFSLNEDCVECELQNRQRAMVLQALAEESMKKGQAGGGLSVAEAPEPTPDEPPATETPSTAKEDEPPDLNQPEPTP